MWNDKNFIEVLAKGGIVIMPTDTLYGIVGQAQNSEAVERVYALRQRSPDKPCIILIGEIGELEKFSITLSEKQKIELEKCWPISAIADIGQQRALSVILDCSDEKFSYLHRGTRTLAFRIPANPDLRKLLLQTGPLIAPSANPEGLPPAQNINEAKKYFGPVRGREGSQRPSASNGVDLYVDGGEIIDKASKVIKLHKDGTVNILRE